MKLKQLAIVATGLALAATSAIAQAPLKIGFLSTLSGPVGAIGNDQYDAFMLAIEQRGGKLGGVPVQVIKEDDQFRPEVGTQAVQKLIEREGVPIITGLVGSNVMMAISKPVAEKQVFLISSNAGPSPLAGAGCSPYQFVVSWTADAFAEGVGKYATERGYKRVSLLAPNYQAGKDLLGGFKRFYKGEVADETYTPLNQMDFSTELAQLAATKPDAVFVFYPGGLGVNFVRQFQQSGLDKTIPLLSAGLLDGTNLLAVKEAALGATVGMHWGPDLDIPASKSFVQAFEAKYKRIPSNYAAQSYDAALLLDSALAKVKGNVSDKPAFAAALKQADFASVRGAFKFNNNNFPIHDIRVFKVVKDAQERFTFKYESTPLKNHADAYHTQCALK